MDQYLVTQAQAEAALVRSYSQLEDYDPTIFGLIWDGEGWDVHEDSLTVQEALDWAKRVSAFGEHVGVYVWDGGR